MGVEDEYLDVLQNIEAVIVNIYHQDPELTDYDVDKALEALYRTYRGEAAGKPETMPRGDRSLNIYEAVKAICDWRLGRAESAPNEKALPEMTDPLSVEEINRCIKWIRKSIALWSKEGGRQGYLIYVFQFLG